MILQVQYCPGDVKVTVQGPQDSPELLHLLSLLQEEKKQFWAWDERGDAVPISPKSIIWAETVDNKVFVYTLDAFYEIPMGLAELENKWGSFGFFLLCEILGYKPQCDPRAAQLSGRTH